MHTTVASASCSLGIVWLAASPTVGMRALFLGEQSTTLAALFAKRFPKWQIASGQTYAASLIKQVIAWIENRSFNHHWPMDMSSGTVFQQRVWQKIAQIPLGATITYAALAQQLANPLATRAVAQACGANPLAILIPCHRVVGHDGSLRGYRWGVTRKRALLAQERQWALKLSASSFL